MLTGSSTLAADGVGAAARATQNTDNLVEVEHETNGENKMICVKHTGLQSRPTLTPLAMLRRLRRPGTSDPAVPTWLQQETVPLEHWLPVFPSVGMATARMAKETTATSLENMLSVERGAGEAEEAVVVR